jgi:hypothetical protein
VRQEVGLIHGESRPFRLRGRGQEGRLTERPLPLHPCSPSSVRQGGLAERVEAAGGWPAVLGRAGELGWTRLDMG